MFRHPPRISLWLWRLFLFWTALLLLLWPGDLGRAQVEQGIPAGWLHDRLLHLLSIADAIWFLLAAVTLYFHLIQKEGLKTARRVAGIILLGAGLLNWIGLKIGFPFGPHVYTEQFGARLNGLPFTVPLLWLVVIVSARYTILHFREHVTRWQLAIGTGVLCLLTDFSLEYVAWRVRAWWLWWFPLANTPDWPPLQNYLCWLIIPTLLAWVAFPAVRPVGKHPRPAILLGLLNLLFWVTITARLWRH